MLRPFSFLALLAALSAAAGDTPGAEVGLGTYRAVLFAAQDYPGTDLDLTTPRKDVAALGGVLEQRYGFEVEIEPAATRAIILDTLDDLRASAGPNDAIIVYFAGHGLYDDAEARGYWLPADATLASRSNWIANDDVAARMRAMEAKHVLLLVDSCFAGALFREVGQGKPVPTPGDSPAARRLAADRSRWVITSGGNEPVADKYRDGMSVFAYFLRKELDQADGRYVIPDTLFPRLRDSVLTNARQKPQQGPFQGTGHENGQIVLLNGRGADPGAESVDVVALARQAGAEHDRRMNEAIDRVRSEEMRDWEAVGAVAKPKTPAARKVLEGYARKWGAGGRTAEVDGESRWVAVGHAAEARAMLDNWGDTGGENPAEIELIALAGGTFMMGSSTFNVEQPAPAPYGSSNPSLVNPDPSDRTTSRKSRRVVAPVTSLPDHAM